MGTDSTEVAEAAAGPTEPRPQLDLDLLPSLLGYHLRRAQFAVFQDFAQTMDGVRVTPGQFGVLTVIAANEGLTQTAVADAMGTDTSAMVVMIDRLEQRGLVLRRRALHDRRSYALALTDEGHRLLTRVKRLVLVHEQRIASYLTDDERNLLIRLLSRINGVA